MKFELVQEANTEEQRREKMTVEEFFEKYSDDGEIADVLHYDDGTPALRIEKHRYGLTLTDSNTSARELGYRDESNEDLGKIVEEWKQCVDWEGT